MRVHTVICLVFTPVVTPTLSLGVLPEYSERVYTSYKAVWRARVHIVSKSPKIVSIEAMQNR